MTGGDDLRRERAVAVDLLADEQEGCDGTTRGEGFEHRGRAGRVRAVVEGHRDADRAGDAPGYPQRPRRRRARPVPAPAPSTQRRRQRRRSLLRFPPGRVKMDPA